MMELKASEYKRFKRRWDRVLECKRTCTGIRVYAMEEFF